MVAEKLQNMLEISFDLYVCYENSDVLSEMSQKIYNKTIMYFDKIRKQELKLY